MGGRCSKEREDRITHQARDHAVLPRHRRNQKCHGALHDTRPFFRVEFFRHGSGALDVTKKNSHHAPFAGSSDDCGWSLTRAASLCRRPTSAASTEASPSWVRCWSKEAIAFSSSCLSVM